MNDKAKLQYPGIFAAVGGIVALLGIYAGWYVAKTPSGNTTLKGTVFTAGDLALWASVATFAFGAAYVIFSDPKIRKAMGGLVTICAMILLVACIWGFLRANFAVQTAIVNGEVPKAAAYSASRALGLFVSLAGAIFALVGGAATLRPESNITGEPETFHDQGPEGRLV